MQLNNDRTINVAQMANKYKATVKSKIESDNIQVKLVAFLGSNDAGSQSYAKVTKRACTAQGIDFDLREVKKENIKDAILEANLDTSVHGILVYYPLFHLGKDEVTDDEIRDLVCHTKDVEGLGKFYRTKLSNGQRFVDNGSTQKCLVPCTPLAALKVIQNYAQSDNKHHSSKFQGLRVTVINRSAVFGAPLASLLALKGALVYSVDVDSTMEYSGSEINKADLTLEQACEKSQVIVTAVPVDSFRVPCKYVRKGTLVINVASCTNVDTTDLMDIDGTVFVPQIGKLTQAMLLKNLLRLYQNSQPVV